MDVFFGALQFFGIEEARVRSIKELDPVVPPQPVTKLGADNRKDWRTDCDHPDIDVVATALDANASGEEAGGNKERVAR